MKEKVENGWRNVSSPLIVSDITKLTPAQLDGLKPGDRVIKQTGAAQHVYIVSYKGEGVGQGIFQTAFPDSDTAQVALFCGHMAFCAFPSQHVSQLWNNI